MKFVRILLGIIVIIAAIIFIGGMFLSDKYSVNRTIMIKAPQGKIYNNIADFNKFLQWNPWSKMDPAAKVKISGPVAQAGHLYEWAGKESGQGQMLIDKVDSASFVDIELKFIKPFESVANTNFTLAPLADSIKVTWSMSGESKATLEKWMYLNMDGMIGKDFESGLKNLKELSEKQL